MVSGGDKQEPLRPAEPRWPDTLASPSPAALPSRHRGAGSARGHDAGTPFPGGDC